MSTPTRELLAQLAEEFNELSERLVKRAAQIAAEAPSAVTVGSRWTSPGPDVHTVAYTVELRRCADGTMQKVSETGSEAGVSAATRDVSGIAQPVSSNTGESSAAAPSPAPSSPRRWWLVRITRVTGEWETLVCDTAEEAQRVHPIFGLERETIPVVEASAYDAAVMRATVAESQARAWRATFDALKAVRPGFTERGVSGMDAAVRAVRELAAERDAARAELAAARQKLAEAEGACVAKCRAARDDEASRFTQSLREARRLTPEVVERAAHDCYRAWAEAPVGSDAFVLTARAALLAAGFQEVAP